MSWLCKIGLHDWESLESHWQDDLVMKIARDNNVSWEDFPNLIGRRVHRFICLKCGKEKNEIAPFMQAMQKEANKLWRRRQQTLKIRSEKL